MQMRPLRWNLVAWNPSAGPADPYGAPRFARLVWTCRARWRPICLATGAVFMGTGLMLPSTVVFITGVVAVGSSAPDARPHSATTATIRTWVWLDKKRADRR
jgi:hypothetical protein